MNITDDILDSLELAVAYLVQSDEYWGLKDEIRLIADTKHGCFVSDYGELNALVKVARENPRRLSALLTLIEQHRADCAPQPNDDTPSSDGNREYQRILMRDRRRRQAKALKLYQRVMNRILPEGEPRRVFYKEIQDTWMVRRDELLKATEPFSNVQEKHAFIRMFWEDLEADIDRALNTNDYELGRAVLGIKPGG